MVIRVVTDSVADLPPEIASRYQIEVVPLNVVFGDEEFRDGIDITAEQFFARLQREPELPTTSQPSVGTFREVYERLVNDMTGLEVMRRMAPVVFDATHSVQYPGGGGTTTGGRREAVPLLTRAAVAAGIDGLFVEVHDDPPNAMSDAATVWPLDQLEDLLRPCVEIREAIG